MAPLGINWGILMWRGDFRQKPRRSTCRGWWVRQEDWQNILRAAWLSQGLRLKALSHKRLSGPFREEDLVFHLAPRPRGCETERRRRSRSPIQNGSHRAHHLPRRRGRCCAPKELAFNPEPKARELFEAGSTALVGQAPMRSFQTLLLRLNGRGQDLSSQVQKQKLRSWCLCGLSACHRDEETALEVP